MLKQDGVTPTLYKFTDDPNYVWVNDGKDIIKTTHQVLGGNSGLVPNGPVNPVLSDLYDRVGLAYRLALSSGNRGYASMNVIDSSKVLTPADMGGLISIFTQHIGTPPTAAVQITLPSRADLIAAGVGYFDMQATSPYFTAKGGSITPITIRGYQTNAGVPLKLVTDNPTTPGSPVAGDDFGQNINVAQFAKPEAYIYGHEYIELIPLIIHDIDNDFWFMTWVSYNHTTAYDKIGQYAQEAVGIIRQGQIKADGTSNTRAAYPRLWQALDTGGFLDSELIAQGSKTNPLYGDGDGTTTFTTPNVSSLGASLVDWLLWY